MLNFDQRYEKFRENISEHVKLVFNYGQFINKQEYGQTIVCHLRVQCPFDINDVFVQGDVTYMGTQFTPKAVKIS